VTGLANGPPGREYREVEAVHGMRASFASWAEHARFMPVVIEASLPHENATTLRRPKGA
jgi:hypothetical protein